MAAGLRCGDIVGREVIVENPKIYRGRNNGFGYSVGYNNCTTYATWAWYNYTGEWLDQRPGPFTNPLPDWPVWLKWSIDHKNNEAEYYRRWIGAMEATMH